MYIKCLNRYFPLIIILSMTMGAVVRRVSIINILVDRDIKLHRRL